MLTAKITDIQHFNVHDGPGIRTVVFFQGCPLRCRWCQNPETISLEPKMLYNPALCIGCGACISACPSGSLSEEGGAFRYDPLKCLRCGSCQAQCFTRSRKLSSAVMTLDQVYDQVMKDQVVYRKSGGGITVSGGEPLLHIDFNTALLARVKASGVTTAVETAGYVPWEYFERIAGYVDTFLFDLKMHDVNAHRRWTGVDNGRIKENLRRLCRTHDNVVVRIPLIPTVNDTEEEFTAMMRFVKGLIHINSVHILPFHSLGAGKYSMLGEAYEMAELPEENQSGIERCMAIAEAMRIKVNLGGTGFVEDKRK